MTVTEIIEALRHRLVASGGRHLYAVLGTYKALASFSEDLQKTEDANSKPFPTPLSVNRGILESLPDDRFKELVEDEAKYPQTARDEVQNAFETYVDACLQRDGLIILNDLEMVFAYGLELGRLRAIAADSYRILLLLPGRRNGSRVELFSEAGSDPIYLPPSLIADNQTWEIGT